MNIKPKLIAWLSKPILSSVPISSNATDTVLIDFSSPNIAKPFHLGHFRATVTGNFIRNINEAVGHNVISVNYLGDWGTQFDLLSYGWRKYGVEEKLATDPICHLNEVYVRINAEVGKSGPPADAALNLMREQSGTVDSKLWSHIRALTIDHLKKTYARMNVQFTAYEYESDSVGSAYPLVQRLLDLGIAFRDCDGAVCIPGGTYDGESRRIVLLKSNGDTLYLTRDLATAISRYERYQFDRMHYVVGLPYRLHIPFARVQGMSTRHGKGLFLSDILDTARDSVLRRMQNSQTTRAFSHSGQCDETVADHLGVTALTIEMLRNNRQKPISLTSFLGHPLVDDSAAPSQDCIGLSGLSLQYCHARLCSLQQKATNVGLVSPVVQDDPVSWNHMNEDLILRLDAAVQHPPSSSSDPSFAALFDHLSSLPASVQYAYTHYEASAIVQFATRLTSCVNSAWRHLGVLNCTDTAEQLIRLSIFMISRDALSACLRLLGIHPLCAI
ncbi:unnamed protein product [Dicrocoelium dendriticum]|nr:unnamed protein product [Dicrocoelium dendriticum]